MDLSLKISKKPVKAINKGNFIDFILRFKYICNLIIFHSEVAQLVRASDC